MKRVNVQTNWKQESEITYTCYDKNGKEMQWEWMNMIGHGNSLRIDKNYQSLVPVFINAEQARRKKSFLNNCILRLCMI